MNNVADLTAQNHLARELHGGGANIIEPDHVGHADGFRRRGHHACVIQRSAERFFTKDRFAGGDRGQGDLTMGGLRRSDQDCFDARVLDQILPAVGRSLEFVFDRLASGAFGGRTADHFANRTQSRIEHGPHRFERDRMGLAHIACADKSEPDRCQVNLPRKSASACNGIFSIQVC